MNCTPSVADPSNSTNYKQPTPRKRRSTPLYFPVHARAGGDASGGHPSFVPKVLSVFLARFDGQGLRKRWRLNVVEMLRLRHGSCAAASGRATRFRREKGAAFWYATASRARIRRENTQKPRLGEHHQRVFASTGSPLNLTRLFLRPSETALQMASPKTTSPATSPTR